MMYIVKFQNLLKMFVSTSKEDLSKRLDLYLPEHQIISQTLGTIQDCKNILKQIPNKNGWFENKQENIKIIKDFIDLQLQDVLKEVDRKHDYYLKKLNRYIKNLFTIQFNWDKHFKCENITYDLDREENLLKNSDYTEALDKIKEIKESYSKFWKIFNAKRYCEDTDPIQVTPDYKLQIKTTWLDSSKICAVLTLLVNDQEFYEVRSFLPDAQ